MDLALTAPDIDKNAASGLGFHHNGHPMDGVRVAHRLRSMALAPERALLLPDGMSLRPLPYRRAVK